MPFHIFVVLILSRDVIATYQQNVVNIAFPDSYERGFPTNGQYTIYELERFFSDVNLFRVRLFCNFEDFYCKDLGENEI